ncbi:ras-domain-containing protein [Stipitochalara longipes BDJ]|nr:ras-domain-containing protein [Stipitochalara longipes BDJ]
MKPLETDKHFSPLGLTSGILDHSNSSLLSDQQAELLLLPGFAAKTVDQPQPKNVTPPKIKAQNAEYDPFRSFPPMASDSAFSAVVLGKNHELARRSQSEESINGANKTANALTATSSTMKSTNRDTPVLDSTPKTASNQIYSFRPPVALKGDEQNTKAMLRYPGLFVAKKAFQEGDPVLNTTSAAKRASIVAGQEMTLLAGTRAEIQSALESSYRPTSSAEITSADSNEQSSERLGIRDLQDVGAVSSASQSTVASDAPVIHQKIVIVGDAPCGKTALLLRFAKAPFYNIYVGTTFDNYVINVEIDTKHVELALYDTAGTDGYERLRPLSYPGAHVILICFAIDSPDSFDNVQEKWISEVLHFCPRLPIILVGTKKDLRNDPKTIEELRKTRQEPVTYEQVYK